MLILTLNAGSSSIKYKVFTIKDRLALPLFQGLIEGIGEESGFFTHNDEKITASFNNHQQAFTALEEKLHTSLPEERIVGIGHRVVHGGPHFTKPTLLTPEVVKELDRLSSLAPLHNPVNLLGIQYTQHAFKDAIQVAVFDTSFHRSLPDYARTYPLPQAILCQYPIERYGFHGINHEWVAQEAALFLQKPLSQSHFISLHLGNGASACLVRNGKSHDTSMGFTPLPGLMMGTRCGDIDPAIIFYLEREGLSGAEIEVLLNKKSGLKGIAGFNDMREVLSLAEKKEPQAQLAIAMYCYSIQKTIGAYWSQCPQLDALIFTGGVGENAALIREKIVLPLAHMGFLLNKEKNLEKNTASCYSIAKSQSFPILVIKGNEEQMMANAVLTLL